MTAPQIRAARTPPGRAASASPPLAVRARDVLASEWTKTRSVRSNYWTLLIAAAVTIGATALVAHTFASSPARQAGRSARCPRASWATPSTP